MIIAIILIKYEPVYKVSVSGEELGYVKNKQALEEVVKNSTIEETKNVEAVYIKVEPEYELKLVSRTEGTDEEQIIEKLEENVEVTYKYYEIALNNEVLDSVNTSEEAEELVSEIKKQKIEEGIEESLDLSIIEKYTTNEEEVQTTAIDVAKATIETKVSEKIEEEKKKKEEEERINSLPSINGIKLAVQPISGVITSRYAESSRLRRSTHTGLDIAARTGTPIKVIASGTVTCAKYSGSYGNLVKVDHGNGVETWYAHTSKMYVSIGQKVEAGEVIAAVGSTGNSTGAHLHLEVRINGNHVNPQNYLYK